MARRTHRAMIGRRLVLKGGLAMAICGLGRPAPARAAEPLSFDDLYAASSPLGLTLSDKLKSLEGRKVRMRGFMAPPLKAEANFFVLTRIPMALCPFCSSDADWPEDIVAIYLAAKQTFVQYQTPIDVAGTVSIGSWTDPDTGFVSQVRLADATFHAV